MTKKKTFVALARMFPEITYIEKRVITLINFLVLTLGSFF